MTEQITASDEMRLIHDCAREFHQAGNEYELEAAWQAYVKPVYEKIDDDAMSTIYRLYAMKSSVLRKA